MCKHAHSCPTLCHPTYCSSPKVLCPWDFPDKNTGVGCHVLLQGIFPTQESNLGLLHCRQILHHWDSWEAPNCRWLCLYMHISSIIVKVLTLESDRYSYRFQLWYLIARENWAKASLSHELLKCKSENETDSLWWMMSDSWFPKKI